MTGSPPAVIVIAYDGSPNARRAVHYAGRFFPHRPTVVLTVYTPMVRPRPRVQLDLDGPPDPEPDEIDIKLAAAQRINGEGLQLARDAGLRAEPLCVPTSGTVWDTIIATADELQAELIVTGTRGTTGIRSLLQASVADHVLRRGRRPVLIVPPES
ncbi:universal stress protein [uncultured Mycolicibacterium sp.]|jgi:Universal stress protein UspA and related nucleotide-binding proteins|uniref:universal stress protein n=1 Tax=uncultured Mycolicibacterium sp. TaxID=2320817 RepID=UPI00261C1923|nr:universal stress protein [uncultured Mycolicibacterium sp.]